jgi:O-antigen ligase
MESREAFLLRCAQWLTFGSAVAVTMSIAVSQTLLALALAALLISGEPLRLPRIKWALGLFMLGTVLSLAFSGEAYAGLPQIRKFYVFFTLLVVYSALRNLKILRWLFMAWAGVGALSAARGFVQFAAKVREAREAGQGFYDFYVGERITGFSSHWNTYSAILMFSLIMIGAYLLFGPREGKKSALAIGCGTLIGVAIVLAQTRGIWIATFAAALYLAWFWKRWVVAILPAVVLAAYFVSPAPVRERFTSIFRPKAVDSNQFRIVTWETGVRMIEAHPLLGLGPEGVRLHFNEYVPPETPRPLPIGWYGHLHNIYLHYAAERGIPTMLVLLWLLIQIVVDCWRALRGLAPGPSQRRFLLHGTIAVVLATMVEGFVELNLGDSEVLAMFLVVVAAGYLATEKDVVEA